MIQDNQIPIGRIHDVVVKELDNEVLIYDLNKNKAFCLNETSALVWRMCDGNRSILQISQAVSEHFKSPFGDDVVRLALAQLKKEDLLENGKIFESKFTNVSRRDAVKKLGLASTIALPLIASIVAPPAANAQSCTAPGGVVMGTFPFGAGMDSNTCLNNLRARCCSMIALAGSSCSCIGNPLPDTCVGTVTCG